MNFTRILQRPLYILGEYPQFPLCRGLKTQNVFTNGISITNYKVSVISFRIPSPAIEGQLPKVQKMNELIFHLLSKLTFNL